MLCLEYIVWYGQFVTKLMWFYRNAALFHIIFVVTHGEIFGHLGHTGPLTVNKMALPSMYRRRWRHIHAFIGKNTIALRVQRFAAGANIICLTYTTDWWAAIDPVIHGESKSQATRSSSDHVGLLRTLSTIATQKVKTRGASCIGGFGQTDGRRKFELGIPQSRGASYIRGVSYIRDKMVLIHITSQVKTRQSQSDKFKKFAKNSNSLASGDITFTWHHFYLKKIRITACTSKLPNMLMKIGTQIILFNPPHEQHFKYSRQK